MVRLNRRQFMAGARVCMRAALFTFLLLGVVAPLVPRLSDFDRLEGG